MTQPQPPTLDELRLARRIAQSVDVYAVLDEAERRFRNDATMPHSPTEHEIRVAAEQAALAAIRATNELATELVESWRDNDPDWDATVLDIAEEIRNGDHLKGPAE